MSSTGTSHLKKVAKQWAAYKKAHPKAKSDMDAWKKFRAKHAKPAAKKAAPKKKKSVKKQKSMCASTLKKAACDKSNTCTWVSRKTDSAGNVVRKAHCKTKASGRPKKKKSVKKAAPKKKKKSVKKSKCGGSSVKKADCKGKKCTWVKRKVEDGKVVRKAYCKGKSAGRPKKKSTKK